MAKKRASAPHSHSRVSLDGALEKLTASSYRVTRPRRDLLEAALGFNAPFSARDLEKKLRGFDPVTIYRTLPVFVELGILEKCDFSDEMTHYEVKMGHESHHHHHVVCTSCRKVEPLAACLIEGQEQLLRRLGYRDLKHRLEFSGLCPSCA